MSEGPLQDYATRNLLITAAIQAGKTLQQVGDDFGITRERVRQICVKVGLTERTGFRRVGCAASGCDRDVSVVNKYGRCQYHAHRAAQGMPDQPRQLLPCGTYAAYTRGCRCPDCKRANCEETRRRRVRCTADFAATGNLRGRQHGEGYVYAYLGCRCEPCITAHSQRCREYKARKAAAKAANEG